jgi:formylglycine-generating enzyme required for sulfatase activity
MNQGNVKIAQHTISRARCLEGLRGITLQTEEQRRVCQHDNMVPISEQACIDVFEFPNRPCELPFVWAGATIGREVCKRLGKRLCTQDEWIDACATDPDGHRQTYAYGEQLDLTACHTNLSRKNAQLICDPSTVKTTWETCATQTEPSGSFPRCRSKRGVFDLHGNVAEAMTRADYDGKTYSQLKGSAFFYVDVVDVYGDTCDHNPRWHVEEMARAWHVNYHLGFRCCADIAR